MDALITPLRGSKPPEAKPRLRFVSIGFAGVVVKVVNDQLQPELQSAYYLDSVHSRAIG